MKTKLLSLTLIGMISMQMVLVACDKPKQRQETVDKDIAANLVQVSDLHEVTSESTKAYFYTSTQNQDISALDKTPQMTLTDGAKTVLNMIKKDDTKKAIDAQLSSGVIAFAIVKEKDATTQQDQLEVKIYKVLTKVQATSADQTTTAQTIADIKKLRIEASGDPSKMTVQNDTDSKTDVEYVAIATVKVAKAGVMDNKRTKYYDEKTSILTVSERPLDVSTHLVLIPEDTGDKK